MSEQEFESGSKDRATVALVYREVANLGKIVEANFKTVHVQLKTLEGLPTKVENLERDVGGLRADVDAINTARVAEAKVDENRRNYRVGTLPLVLTGVGMFVLGLINLLGIHA